MTMDPILDQARTFTRGAGASFFALALLALSATADDPACDERYEIDCDQVQRFPDRMIGLLLTDFDGDSELDSRGTAFIVGHHTVLTSGHCVFDREQWRFPSGSTFNPAVCMQPGGTVVANLPARSSIRHQTTRKYATSGTDWPYKYDIGAMHFACRYDEFDTFMPVIFNFEPTFARLGGYPTFNPEIPSARLPDNDRDGAAWRGFGETAFEGGRVVKYDAKGTHGASGSPVMAFCFQNQEQAVQAYAVNSSIFVNHFGCNRSGGPLFTDKNKTLIREWMNFRPSEEERLLAGCPREDSQRSSWFDVIDLYRFNEQLLIGPDELGLIDPPSAEPMSPSPWQMMQVIKGGFYEFAIFLTAPGDPMSPRFIQLLRAPGMPEHEQWRPGMAWDPDAMGFLGAFEARILLSASMARDQEVIEADWIEVPGLAELPPIRLTEFPDSVDTSDDPQEDEIDQAHAENTCTTDLDGDGRTGGSDLARLLGEWGQSISVADFNGDGMVGAEDLTRLLAAYGDCR